MKLVRTNGLLLTCSLLAATVDVRADTEAGARKAIQAQYARMAVALSKKNVQAYMELCAPGFRHKTPNAVIDRVHMYEQLSQLFAAVEDYKQTTRIERLRLQGKQAWVVTTETCAMSMSSPVDSDKPPHYRQAVHNRDLWIYSGKQWLLQYSETKADN